MGIEPIAMTNAMASEVVNFAHAAVLWSMLLGLLVGSGAGVLLAGGRFGNVRWLRFGRAARSSPLAEAAK